MLDDFHIRLPGTGDDHPAPGRRNAWGVSYRAGGWQVEFGEFYYRY